MSKLSDPVGVLPKHPHPYSEEYYRGLRRRNILRLVLIYVAPIAILAVYFFVQYSGLVSEGSRLHLKAIAESQSRGLDLFLSERVVNLSNLIDDPRFEIPPDGDRMPSYLARLKRNSPAFVDIGYFDDSGVQTAYAGPFPSLEKRNYSTEPWYRALRSNESRFIITDIYLGFRQEPHFTIAVSRIVDSQFVVVRATLEPRNIYDYISTLAEAPDAYISIVNDSGYYQVVTPEVGTPLGASSTVPPREPVIGLERARISGESVTYAYSWLNSADWALIVQRTETAGGGAPIGFYLRVVGIALGFIILGLIVIFHRSRALVDFQRESDKTRAQLEHAAKLASVGELASGIAHEINNPLAIINEEAGLMKDLMNPAFGNPTGCDQLIGHLDTIQSSVFRCRDITRKLLGFVRKTDLNIALYRVNDVVEGVVDGLLGPELAVSNKTVVRRYDDSLPDLLTDQNQLQQVILNIINNGLDAMGDAPGTLTVTTWNTGSLVHIAISDTGCGMTLEQLDNIFMPFYTTKEVGKGTGLGLSVSYGIIKSLGGKIEVESTPGKGSTFTIILPSRQ